MKKFLLAMYLASVAASASAAMSCGIPPIPPIPPMGTTHCDPVCVVDQYGNAHWEFACR